jgi:hypothetical protein
MIYKLTFIFKTVINAIILPWWLLPLAVIAFLLYVMMLRDNSVSYTDSCFTE